MLKITELLRLLLTGYLREKPLYFVGETVGSDHINVEVHA